MCRALIGRWVVALLAAATTAACTPPPLNATDQYVERTAVRYNPAAPPAACRIALEPVIDERRDRKVLGNVTGKTVFAPEDSAAWMRQVLSALEPRGIAVQFLGAGETAPAGLAGRPSLVLAWVTSIQANKSANALMRLQVLRDGSPVLDQEYRGTWTAMNWASGDGEIQKTIDKAFSRLLDSMAVDLLFLCAPAGRSGVASPA